MNPVLPPAMQAGTQPATLEAMPLNQGGKVCVEEGGMVCGACPAHVLCTHMPRLSRTSLHHHIGVRVARWLYVAEGKMPCLFFARSSCFSHAAVIEMLFIVPPPPPPFSRHMREEPGNWYTFETSTNGTKCHKTKPLRGATNSFSYGKRQNAISRKYRSAMPPCEETT